MKTSSKIVAACLSLGLFQGLAAAEPPKKTPPASKSDKAKPKPTPTPAAADKNDPGPVPVDIPDPNDKGPQPVPPGEAANEIPGGPFQEGAPAPTAPTGRVPKQDATPTPAPPRNPK